MQNDKVQGVAKSTALHRVRFLMPHPVACLFLSTRDTNNEKNQQQIFGITV